MSWWQGSEACAKETSGKFGGNGTLWRHMWVLRADDTCQGSRPEMEQERRPRWARGEVRLASHVCEAQAGGAWALLAPVPLSVWPTQPWAAGCPGGTGLGASQSFRPCLGFGEPGACLQTTPHRWGASPFWKGGWVGFLCGRSTWCVEGLFSFFFFLK